MTPTTKTKRICASCLTVTLFLFAFPLAAVAGDTVDLVNLRRVDKSLIVTQDAAIEARTKNDRSVLRVETGHTKRWPGVTFKAPGGSWDLSTRSYLSVELRNAGSHRVKVFCRVDNPGADGVRHCVTESLSLDPGESGDVTIPLVPRIFAEGEIDFIGMRGDPPVLSKLDSAKVSAIVLFVTKPTHDHAFEIEAIRAGGVRSPRKRLSKEKYFPFIDELGQYAHADWPGKTHSVEELVASVEIQNRALDAQPGPSDRTRFGGWASGPKLEATGFFRVEKYRGKWWLVDPEGRLFWSHGVDCVHANASTPISDREHYYQNLPPPSSKMASYYGKGSWAPHGYYHDHSPYRTFDFFRANQLRKYGENWNSKFLEVTHRRLRSWGLNTIGNWSDARVFLARKTPYVVNLSTSGGPRLEGSSGYWGKFPDVFASSFPEGLRKRLKREEGASIGDSWCIGYFVDNELSWGDETSLAIAALTSPDSQPAKKAFLTDLETKYGSIEKLNAAWKTRHASWKALLGSREAPEKLAARDDLLSFSRKTAETYFRSVRDLIHAAAPGQLYLGCRFAWVNDQAARAAAQFCDVVGYNRYSYSVAGRILPEGVDHPVIIGEFHFGALDRGLFHTGLRKARDQKHRAELYENYVLSALRNPSIVGTHWFQWKDQAATGRGDGENYQIGFIDVCDRPYPEIVRATRKVAERMYAYRLSAKPSEQSKQSKQP